MSLHPQTHRSWDESPQRESKAALWSWCSLRSRQLKGLQRSQKLGHQVLPWFGIWEAHLYVHVRWVFGNMEDNEVLVLIFFLITYEEKGENASSSLINLENFLQRWVQQMLLRQAGLIRTICNWCHLEGNAACKKLGWHKQAEGPLPMISVRKVILRLIPSRALWGSWAQSLSVSPISLIPGNSLHSTFMTFPEFQWANSNSC